MCFAEVLLLLHQAEETSDTTKFLTALKFASLLITTIHANKPTFMPSSSCDDIVLLKQRRLSLKRSSWQRKPKRTKLSSLIALWNGWWKMSEIWYRKIMEWVQSTSCYKMQYFLIKRSNYKRHSDWSRTQGNAGEGEDNVERITTFSKLDKMCCESLIFCEDTQLWKGVANQNCLYLRDDLSCINLEMTSVPLIGE